MKARWAVAAIAWVVLAQPASSHAADFYAASANAGTADCLTVANPCTIAVALGKVDDDPGTADVLHLAAGSYAGPVLDVDGAGFNGLVIQGAGRDQTILNQSAAALATPPFTFGDQSDNQTVRDLTLRAAATSTANYTVRLLKTSLTLENVDVHGPPAVISHRVIDAASESPNLTLKGVRVFYSPQTASPASGGVAVAFFSSHAAGDGQLIVENSTVDVAAGPSRAIGISATGDGDAVVKGTVVRMRRTAGAVADQGPAVNHDGALPPESPSLTVLDSAIAGGRAGITAVPHPNQANWVTSVAIERTSIDTGDIGVSENAGSINDIETGANVNGQQLTLTIRDVVAAGGVLIDHGGTGTVAMTCANNFLGNPAGSIISATSGSCTNTNTSALAAALPGLTQANAWNTNVAPAAAMATAFRPGDLSVLLDSATGTGAPSTDLAGNPRLVDAGDADCIAQADRGAYERQDLATSAAACLPPPPAGGGTGRYPGPGPGPGSGATVTPPIFSAVALTPRSPRSNRVRRARLSFRLNKAARVTLTLRRVEKGRKVGRRCQKPSRRNRGRKRCTRLVKVGRRVVVRGVAGANRVSLSRLVGKKRVRRGRYRLTLAAPGAKTATLRFVVRR